MAVVKLLSLLLRMFYESSTGKPSPCGMGYSETTGENKRGYRDE
ncbi:hypothetical protein [Paenibacillus oryzae]|nr:hypothetical protein [Paenibacillus oryzae]